MKPPNNSMSHQLPPFRVLSVKLVFPAENIELVHSFYALKIFSNFVRGKKVSIKKRHNLKYSLEIALKKALFATYILRMYCKWSKI